MSDKERLEGIEESFMEHEYDFNLKKEDIKWLIQQAEKVEDLEKKFSINTSNMKQLQKQNESLQANITAAKVGFHSTYNDWLKVREENKRLREAINNIIEKAMLFGTSEGVYDAIQDAIKVLEGTE